MGISAQVFSALHQLVLNPKFFHLLQPEQIFYPVSWLQGALKWEGYGIIFLVPLLQ